VTKTLRQDVIDLHVAHLAEQHSDLEAGSIQENGWCVYLLRHNLSWSAPDVSDPIKPTLTEAEADSLRQYVGAIVRYDVDSHTDSHYVVHYFTDEKAMWKKWDEYEAELDALNAQRVNDYNKAAHEIDHDL